LRTLARWPNLVAGLVVGIAALAAGCQPTPTALPLPSAAPSGLVIDLAGTMTPTRPVELANLFTDNDVHPQGRLLITEIRATNWGPAAASLTAADFALLAPDGRWFAPPREAQARLRQGLRSARVQPGQTARFRVVFDVDPDVVTYTLMAPGTSIRIDF
jgi:hypothetical protein